MLLYSPIDMPDTLKIHPRKCGGGQEGAEGEEEQGPSPMQPIGAAHELWVRLDTSVEGMWDQSGERT